MGVVAERDGGLYVDYQLEFILIESS